MKKILLILYFLPIFINAQKSAEDHYNEGLVYLDSSNWLNALIAFDLAIFKNSYNPKYYKTRGYQKSTRGDYNGAIEDLNMAIKLKSDSYAAYEVRGGIYLESENYGKAISDFSYIINHYPNEFAVKCGLIYCQRGKSYLYSGKKDEACNDFYESSKRRYISCNSFIKDFCE